MNLIDTPLTRFIKTATYQLTFCHYGSEMGEYAPGPIEPGRLSSQARDKSVTPSSEIHLRVILLKLNFMIQAELKDVNRFRGRTYFFHLRKNHFCSPEVKIGRRNLTLAFQY